MPTPRKYANRAEQQAAYRRRLAERAVAAAGGRASPPTQPGPRRWRALLRQALQGLETVQEEMESYYDQRSERWQESERGEALLERLQSVQEVKTALEELDA